MELFIRSTFAVIQAFAGNPGNFLGRTLEWPWYGLWVQAFYGVVDPRKVVAGPQFELAKMQNTNDGGVVFKKKVPDFVLHYVTGVPLYHDIDSLLRVTNHEELLQFYEGRCALTSSIVLAVCEVKALPDPTKIPAGDQFQAVLKKRLFNIQGEARSGARKQVSLHLSAHRDLDEVVAIAIFGPYFSWRILAWDAVSDISSNDDPTYHASESDGGDSSGDQAPRGPSVHQDQEIPDFLAAADRPAGRPKRGPHPVKEYVQYSILKAERLSTSEDDDTKKHPAQKLKGKAKALGTSVMEPEEKAILDGERADDEKADDAKEGGKKAGGKKAGGKKEGGKKAGGKKADDKKADGKKTDGKKTDGKKTDGKKTDGKKTDGKKADGKMEENKEENKKNKGKGKAREREKEEVKAAEDKKEKAEAPRNQKCSAWSCHR
ncbi:uncharacterized protein B0H18DRAFT_1210803, partial [Fomitopsis serialis]|uniref:uncharacterized protein n=1 Tax=Fomitopsis serialis TaxID=139415 RepID=UPI002007E2F6